MNKDKFVENCRKLSEKNPEKYRIVNECLCLLNGWTVPFFDADEPCLRQLIYHEFGYDVEIWFNTDPDEADWTEVFLTGMENGYLRIKETLQISTKWNPDLSHWTTALMEVFNKLCEERDNGKV